MWAPSLCTEFLTSLRSKTCYFPERDDLSGAAQALLRLQDVYALPTDKLARGELVGVIDSPHMTGQTLSSVSIEPSRAVEPSVCLSRSYLSYMNEMV